MAEEVAGLNFRLEATLARFERNLDRARRKMDRTAGRMQRRADSLDRRFERFGNRFGINLNPRIIAGTAALAAFGKAINDVIRNGDRLKQLEGRFRALTGSASRAGELIQSAFAIGSDTGAPFEAITEALTRFRIAGDAINATDEEVAELTGNLLKLGQIGGSTTQELTAGAIQLGQGLASGRLQGEELRSVMENLPLVARELAEGLGVSVGELREMGAAGALTAESVFGALIRGSDDIEERFSNLPVTVDRAANQAASSWTRFTAELDQSLGVSQGLVNTLGQLPGILDAIAASLDEQQRSGSGLGGLGGLMNRLGVRGASALFGEDFDAMMAARREARKQSRISPAAPVGSGGTRQAPQSLPEGFFPPLAPFKFSGGAPSGFAGFDPAKGGEPKTDDTAVQMLQSLRERVELLREEQQLVGRTGVEHARLSAAFEKERIVRELVNAAAKEGATITPEQIGQAKDLADEWERQAVVLAEMEQRLEDKRQAEEDAAEAARQHEENVRRVGDAIANAIIHARTFEDALKNVATALLNIAMQQFSNTFSNALSGALGGLFSAAPSSSPIPVPRPSAKGNAFDHGRIMPFARGGVVQQPTLFPMANGMGLMGEAGPEAILPLKRGPGGRLGVEGGGSNVHVEIINNTGAPVSQERQQTLDGERLRIIIGEMVATELNRPGSAPQRALSTGYGARPVTRRR